MAVDTRDKRFSLISLSQPIHWFAPNPDGAFDTEQDRGQLVYMYSGITASGPAPSGNVSEVMLMWRRRRR